MDPQGLRGRSPISSSNSSKLENAKYSSSCVSRRLVPDKSDKTIPFNGQREIIQTLGKARFYDKSGQILPSSKSERDLHRNSVLVSQRDCLPNSRQLAKIRKTCFALKKVPTAKLYRRLFGLMASCITLVPNACLHMRPIQLHLLHFWSPAKISANRDSLQHSHRKASKVVARQTKIVVRKLVLSESKLHKGTNDRCIQTGLLQIPGKSYVPRKMVIKGKEATYKLSRDEGSLFGTQEFPTPAQREQGIDKIRQCNSSSIYKQTGRNIINTTLLSGVGSMEIRNSEQHKSKGSTYSRQSKQISGRPEPGKNSTNRVVTEQFCCRQDFSGMGENSRTPVRITSQSQNSDILLMVSEPTSISH